MGPMRSGWWRALGRGLIAIAAEGGTAGPDRAARRRLVEEIESDIRLTASELGFSGLDPGVRQALLSVPRERFVPVSLRPFAYANRPLPIGEGQTISQPFIVAIMSQLAAVVRGDRVLELGTGSGYQAAMLAELGAEVYSIEIVEPVGLRARATLDALGYDGVHTRIGDGYGGWPEAAPFDAVLITAAGGEIPAQLAAQLRPGGRLVMPLREAGGYEMLIVATREPDGTLTVRPTIPVRFVPITGGH